ncbi:TrmH family RNA methyltransferase [Vampirovibrio sp.]|uniref:TrmH family RNA methyltransferase n=1 Tax=Vampirovibrio sp. TaxID=2717857 RepID=UPI003594555C
MTPINPQPVNQQLMKDTAALKQKKFRDQSGLILVEGRHPIEEAWRAGLKLHHWFTLEDSFTDSLPNANLQPQALLVDDAAMAKMASTHSPPPCLAVFEAPPVQSQLSGHLVLVLDDLQDPGNLGTLIRSAMAFGVDTVALTADSVEVWNPKVIRASAGMVFALKLITLSRESLHNQLSANGYTIYATTGQPNALNYRQANYKGQCAIVLGNEGRGVSADLLKHPQAHALTIPMQAQVESLNVGISGSIILAEAAAQRAGS